MVPWSAASAYGGGQAYFWPGVPTDQRYILQVLEQNEWQVGGQITNMVGLER
jgi:hypothetical protein